MDPTVAAAIVSASAAILGPFALSRWDKARNKRITDAITPAVPTPAGGVSLSKKSGEEQFIDYLKDNLASVTERLEALEAKADADAELIKAQAAELIECRARLADLERHDREKDAYIIILQHWGAYSTEPPPRTPPPWTAVQ
jgi:hypothetical protein